MFIFKLIIIIYDLIYILNFEPPLGARKPSRACRDVLLYYFQSSFMIECGFNILPAEYMRDPSALNAMDSTEPFIFRLPIHCFVCKEKKVPAFPLAMSS